MGRSKPVPHRRRQASRGTTTANHNDDDNDRILGRRTLDLDASVDAMVAAEVEDDRRQRQRRAREHNSKQEKGAGHDKGPTAPSSRLASVLARIEGEEEIKALAKETRRKKKTKRKRVAMAKTTVSFAPTDSIISPPHIQIVREDHASDSDDRTRSGTNVRYTIYYDHDDIDDCDPSSPPPLDNHDNCNHHHPCRWRTLGVYPLPSSVTLRCFRSDTVLPRVPGESLVVSSAQGAMDLWCFLRRRHHDGQHDGASCDPPPILRRDWLSALGRTVRQGVVSMTLRDHCLQMALDTNHEIVRACATLPRTNVHQPRRTGTTTYRATTTTTAADVHQVLALLHPTSDIASAWTPQRRTTAVTTARQVYQLTDNVQLQAAMLRDNDDHNQTQPPFVVPGLLPVLRPYQEKAVQWMLRQETDYNHEQRQEWQLAWVVLTSSNTTTTTTTKNSTAHCDYEASSVTPLMDWMASRNDASSGSCPLLFNPYTGWLATTVDDARTMTLSSSSSATPSGGVGILAESMGLGKTVEVLACILAHPRWPTTTTTDTGSESAGKVPRPTPFVRRQLDFDAPASVVDSVVKGDRVSHTVDDMNTFCDMDTDDESVGATVAQTSLESNAIAGDPSSGAIAVVTPGDDDVDTEERWIDDDEVGACICGELISFSNFQTPNPTIVCQSCHEPMHMHCAGFQSELEMNKETKPLRLRQTYSNAPMPCRLCQPQRCPCCVKPQPSGATLIITPPAILNQWEREIHKHTKKQDGQPLRVVVYEGIKRLAQACSPKRATTNDCPSKYMHPDTLANADIVLMTFDALMSDLTHTDDNHFVQRGPGGRRRESPSSSGKLRRRKRYRVVPSPLLAIQWWRVCLDEAQRVETPTAGSARMALKLESCHRWCVSGTPIGRGKLDDLYGLLLFLRMEPFNDRLWFRKCFDSAVGNLDGRISHLLSRIFWRSTKHFDEVRKQMGIPEQVERRILLNFSSIEKHFYQRQLERVLSAAGDLVERNSKAGKRKSSQLFLLADHMHKLRAACLHPQVGLHGIASVKRSRGASRKSAALSTTIGSHVMTMRQILDTFIEEAKQQCEEAQRIVVLHTNGMASCSTLMVEAKTRGATIPETDVELLRKSCNLYAESVRVADDNAVPTLLLHEALLEGSIGFRCTQQKAPRCKFTMDWKWAGDGVPVDIWSKFDLQSSAAKITKLRVRSITEVPHSLVDEVSEQFKWQLIFPKDCTFQCLSAAGEYIAVRSFSMPHPEVNGDSVFPCDGWASECGFRTSKAKSWRLVVDSWHGDVLSNGRTSDNCNYGTYLGVEVECFEATIANDPLQRLHCLHNAALSFSSLLQIQESQVATGQNTKNYSSKDEVRKQIASMSSEATKIETWYLDAARAVHNSYHRRFVDYFSVRSEQENELLDLAMEAGVRDSVTDCWDAAWWDDFLVICRLHGTEEQQRDVCERLLNDLDGYLQGGIDSGGIVPFPLFRDINGLRTALQMRIHKIRSANGLGSKPVQRGPPGKLLFGDGDLPMPREIRFKCVQGALGNCMQSVHDLSPIPTDGEILENSQCKVCKADWFKTGPKCRHCQIGEELEDLQTPDRVTLLVLSSLNSVMKGNLGSSLLKVAKSSTLVTQQAKKFFELMEAAKKEHVAAWRKWRTHLDLLNDLDELNQCKGSMRLTFEDEDVTKLTEDELNMVIAPVDIRAKYMDHEVRKTGALGQLNRAKGTLNFLKNQSADDDDKEKCSVCLSAFDDTNRAVLRCGHSFHLSPCLQELQSRSGGPENRIHCPFRCRVLTGPNEYKLASHRKHDDGSHSKRHVKGSWGTKVTRLVSDLLDVCDSGDKSLVFSQWDDMLEICGQAMTENGISFVRATSLRHIGACTNRFRTPGCSVMLLNVKNGAEGLTLLEATHVFMLEPLLNCGLDSQAINRIHRIGQNRKTTVWRYIVANTVEVKIDKLRMEHQADQIEDSINEGKKSMINAGGVDGGFQSHEELLQMLQS